MSGQLVPWTPGDAFDRAMTAIERRDPRGPAATIERRLLYWHVGEKLRGVWSVPDGVFEEWGSSE